ncbi:MAG: glycine betaine ABC transporter substrate-binding protein [Halofilum sp. (in: g-proteobacteria)]|nr:glycine betaine ABC transporter substrate-binding protein [Halofilum sp. (in: g-proteobacteria)]
MMKRMFTALVFTAALATGTTAMADSHECNTVRFGQVNWTGVSAKTETAAWMLNQMGYETDIITASVPIMFESLADDERDAFLGLWLPTQRSMVQKRMAQGKIDIVTKNLEGAKYTVGVNQEAWEAGVRHFSDLKDHLDKFDGEILGIEAGNDGNQIIQQMIDDNAYGMGDFALKPSSEAGMLTEVQRRIKRDKWAAWLAWAPHPMNLNIDLQFLNGGEDYWGPNQGGATVYTLARQGYAWQCPNAGQFLENYSFTVEEQSRMAGYVINEGLDYAEAGRRLIKEQPELLDRWFGSGGTYQTGPIKTADGKKNAKDAVMKALSM